MKHYHQKNHGRVIFDNKCYQDAVLVAFTATPSDATTATYTGGGCFFSIIN